MSVKRDIDLFISHSQQDHPVAEQSCALIEKAGLKCWISARDIDPAADWAEEIVDAIKRSRAVLVLLSTHSNNAQGVHDEITQARRNKNLKIVTFCIGKVEISKFMEYHLRSQQWIEDDGQPLETRLEALTAKMQTLLHRRQRAPAGVVAPMSKGSDRQPGNADAAAPRPPARTLVAGQRNGSRAGAEFKNPYDFNGAATELTFKGRQAEIQDLVNSIESGTHTAIFGLQRTGKTSLMEKGLRERLPELEGAGGQPILLVDVDFQKIGGEQIRYRDFLHTIIEAVTNKLVDAGVTRAVDGLRNWSQELFTAGDYQPGDRMRIFTTFGKVLQGIIKVANRRIVLFIDEFSEVRKVIERSRRLEDTNPLRSKHILPHDLFIDVPFLHHLSAVLKDPALKGKFVLFISVRPFMSEYDEKADLQILKLMKPITLYFLDEQAAKALISEPLAGIVSFEDGAVDYLYHLTAGHPYVLQFMMQALVDRLKTQTRPMLGRQAIKEMEDRMISEGPAYDALFAVLISDYSVEETLHKEEAEMGRGTLAMIAKFGDEQEHGWVDEDHIFDSLKQRIPKEKTAHLLSQLARTKILEEDNCNGKLRYRVTIPLLRRRFVRQNMYLKYFRQSH